MLERAHVFSISDLNSNIYVIFMLPLSIFKKNNNTKMFPNEKVQWNNFKKSLAREMVVELLHSVYNDAKR